MQTPWNVCADHKPLSELKVYTSECNAMAAWVSNGTLTLGLFQSSQMFGSSFPLTSDLFLCCQKSPVVWLNFVSISTTLFLRYWYIYTIPLTAPTASILSRKTLWKWSQCHCSFSGLSPRKAKVVAWFPLMVPSTHAPNLALFTHTQSHQPSCFFQMILA